MADLQPSLSKTLTVASATFGLLIAPDIAFRLAGYDLTSVFKSEAKLTVAILAIMLTLMPSRRCRIAVIAFAVVGQAIWLGCLRYFGAVLSPEQLMLVTSEVRDTVIGITADFQALLPVLALSIMVASGLWFLHARQPESGIWRQRGSGAVLLILLIVISGRGAVMGDAVAAFPGLHTESAIGTYRTAFSALRLSLVSTKVPPGRKLHNPKVSTTGPAEDPLTVVVIMGEGINPARLSLFGASADTSPNLHSWLSKPPPGMTLFSRIGFSSGVATRASVPSFIRPSFIPVEGEWRGVNLFDLARRSGFKTWVFSAQSQQFVSAAGGAPGAEQIKSRDGNETTINEIKDDYLVDLVRSVPADHSRYQFFFVHQRVNHIPYLDNCSHLSETLNVFSEGAGHSVKDQKRAVGDERRANYDDGLRCWDRNVAALVSAFDNRRGAIHIIITADHNELMGEDGLFGHLHPTLRCAAVPFILLTNRPDSSVANQFRTMSPASFYNLSRVVAKALGSEIDTPDMDINLFYMNKTLAFGMAGYMEARQIVPWYFTVRSFNRDGKEIETRSVDLSDLGAAEDYAKNPINNFSTSLKLEQTLSD